MVANKKPVFDLPINKEAVSPTATHNIKHNPTNLHGQLTVGEASITIKTTNTHNAKLSISVGKKFLRC